MSKNCILPSLVCLLFFNTHLLAEETKAENAEQTLRRISHKLADSSRQGMAAPMAQLQFSLTGLSIANHWLTNILDNGRFTEIELEDESHWEVSAFDVYILKNWRTQDSLVITPNYSWFNQYDYYITNKDNNNSYVKSNPYVGSLSFGLHSHWIVDIDYLSGHVYLENQTGWCIDPQDNYVLKGWTVNDHVIFGMHDSWLSSYDYILINVNMDNHARAKQY